MHDNSLNAYGAERIKLRRRASEVLGVILQLGHCTDRQIKEKLNYSEMNAVRPRITELIKKGLVEEAGRMRDKKTGRRVRIVKIADKRADEVKSEQAAGAGMVSASVPEKSPENRKAGGNLVQGALFETTSPAWGF